MFENVVLNYLRYDDNEVNSVDELVNSYVENDVVNILEDKLCNLRILDPNCGNGRYLVGVTQLLFRIHEKLMDFEENPSIIKRAWIIYDSIYAIDYDKHNIFECKDKLTRIFSRYIPNFTDYYFHAKIIHANPLVDDPLICPEAFNWHDVFNEVLDVGGFDICIGNISFSPDMKVIRKWGEYLSEHYVTYSNIKNIYSLFYERSLKNMKKDGVLSFISPNRFLNSLAEKKLRGYLLTFFIDSFSDFRNMDKKRIFTRDLCCITITNKQVQNDKINVNNRFKLNQNYLSSLRFNFFDRSIFEVYDKIMSQYNYIRDFDFQVTHRGLRTHLNKDFIIDDETYDYLMYHEPESSHFIKPVIKGCDVRKGLINHENRYVIFTREDLNIHMEEYPFIQNYLYKTIKDSSPSNGNIRKDDYIRNEMFEIKEYEDDYKIYENEKIIYPIISNEIFGLWDNDNYYIFDNLGIIVSSDMDMLKILYAMFNSNVYKFLLHMKMNILTKAISIKKEFVETLPFIMPDDAKKYLIVDNVDKLINNDYSDEEEKLYLESKINFLIYSVFGLSYKDVDVIENYLEQVMSI